MSATCTGTNATTNHKQKVQSTWSQGFTVDLLPVALPASLTTNQSLLQTSLNWRGRSYLALPDCLCNYATAQPRWNASFHYGFSNAEDTVQRPKRATGIDPFRKPHLNTSPWCSDKYCGTHAYCQSLDASSLGCSTLFGHPKFLGLQWVDPMKAYKTNY